MMDIRLIAAVGRSGQLGLGGNLPWRDPIDLRWFKETTMGGVVLMGGRTYDTVGVLPGRIQARWSGRASPFAVLTQITERHKGKVIWIAGGSFTYASFMPFVRIAVITRIDYDGEADSYMPPLWGHDRDRATHNRAAAAIPGDRGPEPGSLLLPAPAPQASRTGEGSKPVARKRHRQPWLSPRRRRKWKRRTD
jgi:dihydromethanopterin reductase